MGFVLLLVAFGGSAVASGADPVPDQAAWMFNPDAVVEIDLGGLSQEEIDELEDNPDEYQPGTFELRVGGVAQGPALGEVGIRLKGGFGSFRPLSEKAAFKIKFNEYVSQTFFGLKKLTLNNMVQDPSMIHETLTYELFRALGVPASRTGYAFVRLNGQDYGLHLNIETLDKISLPRWFDSTGHLYEADEAKVDVKPGGAGEFEVDEGDDEDLSDLEALIAAANDEDGDWSDGMAAVADLEQMTRQWAVERYVGHWDGYAGEAGTYRPNNYYLHSDDAGLFQMLPWGTDQTWGNRLEFDEPAGGILFNRCFADASCKALYVDALEDVRSALGGLELGQHAAELFELLAPYRALEVEPRLPYTPDEIEEIVEETCEFIAERPEELAEWLELAAEPPAAPCSLASSDPEPDPGQGSEPSGPVLESTVVAEPPRPTLWVGRSRMLGTRVITPMRLPGPGRAKQLVTARLGKARQIACAVRKDAELAGFVELQCRLSAMARRQLELGSLPLIVTVSFTTFGGDPDLRTRRVVAAKRPAGSS
jgi:CotH protein